MGSVKLETRNEGRGLHEWDYLPLSEERVVAQLIKNRWRQDESFYPLAEETSNPTLSNGVFQFSEPVLCTYMDQDALIGSAGLSRSERRVIDWLMRGYSGTDIAQRHGTSSSTVSTQFKRAVERICAENNRRWASYVEQNQQSRGNNM